MATLVGISTVTEGTAEGIQEGITIGQRFAIDEDYDAADAKLRFAEATFLGAFAGGGVRAIPGAAATSIFRQARNALDDSFLLRDARLQDLTNRQNSIDNTDTALDVWWHQQQTWIIENVKRIYKEALERGIAKEQARAILPEGNTISRLYVNGTIRSWIPVSYTHLRAHET